MTNGVSIPTDAVIAPVTVVSPEETAALEALKAQAEAAPVSLEDAAQKLAATKATEEAAKVTAAAERPAWLPEKFKTVDDFVKSHQELESKLGTPKEEVVTPPKEGEVPKVEAEVPLKASDVVAKLNESYLANDGKLTDADYALAEKNGFDRDTVDRYRAGEEAVAREATRRITDAAGGDSNLQSIFAWAKTGLTSAEIDIYNKSFQGADVNAAEIAMEQLKTKYEKANGKPMTLLGGKQDAGGDLTVYRSWAEVSAAMADPRYNKDARFRGDVQARLGRSNVQPGR